MQAAWTAFEQQVQTNFSSYPRVKIWLAGHKDTGDGAGQREEEWAGGCYRLLLQTKDNIYIFWADGMSDKVPTEIISRKKVEAIRVLPLYRSSAACQ